MEDKHINRDLLKSPGCPKGEFPGFTVPVGSVAVTFSPNTINIMHKYIFIVPQGKILDFGSSRAMD